ncbi:hypothetical protein GF358_02315 [Candidatus Woesearchaeota archaeon]|nr:hypothetical protein [Candidatus Woesearchaeota archaeon]
MAKKKKQCINANKTGLALGIILIIWHIAWLAIVGLGYGQAALDSLMRMHMLSAPWAVTGFNTANALTLLLVAFVSGYITGWLFAKIWNNL